MPDVNVKFGGDTSALTSAIDIAKSAFGDIRSVVDQLGGSFEDAAQKMSSVTDSAGQVGSTIGEAGNKAQSTAQGPLAAFATRVWEMRQSLDGVKSVGGGVTGMLGALEGGLARLSIVAGIVITGFTAASAAIAASTIEAAHYGEAIRTAAGASDQSVEATSRLKALADRSGVSIADLGKTFEELQRKARNGDEQTSAALAAIGVSAKEAGSLSEDALAVRMADAFSKAHDSSNKAQAGVELFGEAATKLVPQLDQGANRLMDLYAAATRAGVVIGPDLSAKLQGTERGIQGFRDSMSEMKEAMQGMALQGFSQFKAAFDSLVALFSDLIGNVAHVIEYLFDLNNAGRESGQTLGWMGQAANGLAGEIIKVAAAVEEFGVRVGGALMGVYRVEGAVFIDMAKAAAIAANALYTTFTQAIRGVILAFGDLASAIGHAFIFDKAGVSAAYKQLGADVSSVGANIRQAFTPDFASSTKAAWKAISDGASESSKAIDGAIAKIEAQKKAQLELLAAGGVKGGAVQQSSDVGNPRTGKDGGGSSDDHSLIDAALREADGQIQALKSVEQNRAMLAEAGAQLHQSTENEMTSTTKTALNDRYNAEKAIYDKIKDMDGMTPVQHQEVLNKLKRAEEAYHTDVLRLQIQAAEATQRTWDEVTDRISGAFQGQVDGILQGTTRIGQAFKNVMQQMLGDAVKFCIGWAARHAETITMNVLGINKEVTAQLSGEAAKTSATEAGVASRVGSEIAGVAASAGAMLASVAKSIAAFAAQAFAGVTAFLSPLMGPAAIGPAAATEATVMAAAATIPSLAVGAYDLPNDTLALLHQGEMVVPKAPAQAFRDAMSGMSGGQSSNSVNFHGGINVNNPRNADDFIRQLASPTTQRKIRRSLLTMRPAL